MRVRQEQQAAKKADTLKKLEQDVAQRTAAAKSLPIVQLYADEQLKNFVSSSIKAGDSFLALAWSDSLPSTVYAKDAQGKVSTLSLASDPHTAGAAVVYRPTEKALAQVTDLPDFGSYDLQLVVLADAHGAAADENFLGIYANGHLTIPAEKISTLQHELDSASAHPKWQARDAIALLKTVDGGFLPVAIYRSAQGLLEPLDAVPSLSGLLKETHQKVMAPEGQKGVEKFYVLETPYQQLVFSNFGGALVEINLPFESKADKESVVKEIEFDREMVEKHPYNAHFPAHAYYTPGASGNGEFTYHPQGALGGYYPLLRRDLIEKDPRKTIKVQPRYYALNIVSEYADTAELVYEVKSFDKEKIVFETVQGHRRITKEYSVASESQAPYAVDLTVQIQGDSRGLWLTSGIPEVEWISGAPAPALKFRITRNNKPEVENLDLPKDSTTVTSIYPDWITNSNGFFGLILDPLTEIDPGYRAQVVAGTVVPSRLVEIGQEYQRFDPKNMPGYMMMLPLKSSGGSMHFRVFAGPFADSVLKKVDATYSNPTTGYNPDYIASQSFHGWFAFISEPFAKFLFVLMNFFHSLTGSWAFSIILLTVALRVMLYPLNAWSTKSMLKMQMIAPEVTALQEKYKKDPKKAQLEVMNLYRERGVNPVSGCLPLLIQMPFLIGMFDLLKSTFELRGASFIPGWIDNLTAPDVLFSWETPIFFIGNQFHLLPILLGVVMYLQQNLMSSLPKDPSLWTEQQRQQKFMGNIMTVVFAVMFYNFPSGLNIYWLSSMLLGMLQQFWTTKSMKKEIAKSLEKKDAAKPSGKAEKTK